MKTKTKRILARLLAALMLITCLAGCGKGTDSGTDDVGGMGSTIIDGNEGGGSGDNSDAGGQNPQSGDQDTAMGRYVENVTDLSDSLAGFNRIYKLTDGRLIITDSYKRFLISEDNGETWQEDNFEWHARLIERDAYIGDIAFGADGTAAVICNSESDSDDTGAFMMELHIIKPDGTDIIADIPLTADESYPMGVGISDDGRIFASVLGSSNIYEIKADGSGELFMTLQEDFPETFQFFGSLMLMDGADYGCPVLYDIEKKEYVEDECLENFIKENYPEGNVYSGEKSYEVYYFPGEEGVMYIAGKKGLYRHAIGGSAIEQLIDGSICTFNNPTYRTYGMLMLENNEFLTIFSGGRLVRYVYDPDVATAPSGRLKIYSLKENDTIRQAISLYQTSNPDFAVEYEVGMETGGAATREDALKSLNTKIMSGDGPDVLILDDMPIDSYIEKGLLTDISGVLNGLNGEDEIFGNIAQAMKTDDKVYAMPCEIQIPIIAGEEKYVSGMNNLTGIADMTEKIREDNPGKDIYGIFSENGILRYFAMVCAPAWIENGELNKGSIEEFLTQSKRIYDAQMEGMPAEDVKQYSDTNVYWEKEFGELREESRYFRERVNAIFYTGGLNKLVTGAIDRTAFGYDSLCSINKVAGFEDCKWRVMNGQSSNVFCAKTLLGISAASKNAAAAEEFVKLCLGKENQSTLYYGIAVNKAAFTESFVIDESWLSEDGAYSFESSSNADGLRLDFITYQSDENQIAELRKCIEEADTPYIEDTVLENAVYQSGVEYISGNVSLEEAVNAIEKKISIYMAE